MTLHLIDSHCHLDDDRFDEDRPSVVARALDVGIDAIVIPATTAQRWSKVAAVADSNPSLHPAYGLHPMFMPEHRLEDLTALDAWLDQHKAVAVGECGLDFYHSADDEVAQLELFRGQLQIAVNHQLPIIVHARKALDQVIREIRRTRPEKGGAIHSFSGSLQQATQLVDLGFKLGIAATVAFDRARKLRDVVTQIDIEALLIESDAPDQPGPQHRGERNEPAYLMDHLPVMAELRGQSVKALSGQLTKNCRALFAV